MQLQREQNIWNQVQLMPKSVPCSLHHLPLDGECLNHWEAMECPGTRRHLYMRLTLRPSLHVAHTEAIFTCGSYEDISTCDSHRGHLYMWHTQRTSLHVTHTEESHSTGLPFNKEMCSFLVFSIYAALLAYLLKTLLKVFLLYNSRQSNTPSPAMIARGSLEPHWLETAGGKGCQGVLSVDWVSLEGPSPPYSQLLWPRAKRGSLLPHPGVSANLDEKFQL